MKIDTDKVARTLKEQFEENPMSFLTAGMLAVGSVLGGIAKLNNSRTWKKEVKRRERKK